MIWLRQALERAARRRWLGIVILALLAILLVFVVLHTLHHTFYGDALYVAFVVFFFAATVVARIDLATGSTSFLPLRRGPPRAAVVQLSGAAEFCAGTNPLRM